MPSDTTTIQTTASVSAGHPHSEMMQDEYRVMYEVEDQHWWYRGMRRNLQALLGRHFDWQAHPSPAILDAGCGTGANLEFMLNGLGRGLPTSHAVGFDLSGDALDYSRQRGLGGRLAQASITQLPFAEGSFDLAISFDVINNLPDDRLAFREISRVLRHGGLFLVNLPAYQFLYSEHDLAIRGQRRYNAKAVVQRLAEAGMLIERQTYLNTLLFAPAALVRLAKARRLTAQPTMIRPSGEAGPVHSDLTPPAPLVNRTLEGVMGLETRLLEHSRFNLPFGLSIMTLARKM